MFNISIKLMRNILKDPFNPKYRVISSNSEKLNNLFFNNDTGQAIISNLGFKFESKENETNFFKNSKDCEDIRHILEIYQRANTL